MEFGKDLFGRLWLFARWWFVVLCGSLWSFTGDLWSFVVVCGRLLVVCGRLWWFVVVVCFSNYDLKSTDRISIYFMESELKKGFLKGGPYLYMSPSEWNRVIYLSNSSYLY